MNDEPPEVVDLHPSEWESEKHSPKATIYWDAVGALIIGAGILLYRLIFG